jgi:hypothetical protein
VQYVDIREVFTRSPGATNDNFAVQVPEPPPGAAATGGLEVVEMVDCAGKRSGSPGQRYSSSGARKRPITYPVTITVQGAHVASRNAARIRRRCCARPAAR